MTDFARCNEQNRSRQNKPWTKEKSPVAPGLSPKASLFLSLIGKRDELPYVRFRYSVSAVVHPQLVEHVDYFSPDCGLTYEKLGSDLLVGYTEGKLPQNFQLAMG